MDFGISKSSKPGFFSGQAYSVITIYKMGAVSKLNCLATNLIKRIMCPKTYYLCP